MGGKSGKQVPFWDGAAPETPKFVKERTMELRCYQAANAVVIMLSARDRVKGKNSVPYLDKREASGPGKLGR